MMDNAAVMMLVAMSGPFSYAVTYVNLPQSLASFIFGITTPVSYTHLDVYKRQGRR